jgi:predicted Zn-dependent protease
LVTAISVVGQASFFAIGQVDAGQAERINRARQSLAQGDGKQAEGQFRELLRREPGNADYMLGLGMSLHLEGRVSDAIPVLLRATRLKPSQAGLNVLALDYCRIGEFGVATPLIDKLAPAATESSMLASFAECYTNAALPYKAAPLYEKLANGNAQPLDQYLAALARAYLRSAHLFAIALQKVSPGSHYADIIREAQQTGSSNARGGFEEASQSAGYFKADTTLEQALALYPKHTNDPGLLYVLTVLAGERGIAALSRLDQEFPQSLSYRCLRAEMLASQGRQKEAEEELELVGKSPLADISIYHAIAMYYRFRKNWDGAFRYFQRERALDRMDESAAEGMSEALLASAKNEQARSFLAPFVAAGSCRWAAIDLAKADQAIGQFDEAITSLRKAEACDPDNALVHYHLGQLLEKTNKPEEGRRELALFAKLKKQQFANEVRGVQ